MTVKRTLKELVEIIINNGVEPERAKAILIDLGFPREKVEEIIAQYASLTSSTNEKRVRAKDTDVEELAKDIVIKEELKRQREELQRLEEDVMKLIVEVNNLNRRVKTLEDIKAGRALELKIKELEAKLEAFIDVIIDHVPQILQELSKRGIKQ